MFLLLEYRKRHKQYHPFACKLCISSKLMKIIHTKGPVNAEDLKSFLETELPPLFKKQRQADIDFVYTLSPNGLEIAQPDMYEDFLFRIAIVNDQELHVTKSEHYTDDVNVLTIEDIMNNLFMEYPGRDNIESINEES